MSSDRDILIELRARLESVASAEERHHREVSESLGAGRDAFTAIRDRLTSAEGAISQATKERGDYEMRLRKLETHAVKSTLIHGVLIFAACTTATILARVLFGG